ncbi:MAG: hypothetical protein HY271_03780 [Deltaproteobacteria bacterium]|nr:hypothetical protein [Deltaproteobacteria bacterium]
MFEVARSSIVHDRSLTVITPAGAQARAFTSTTGAPIEPKAFSEHWYDCLRALGLRVRGLYCTNDTYVSLALQTVRDPWWVEKETGVTLATLKAHYAKWMPDDDRTELHRLTSIDPSLLGDDSEMVPGYVSPVQEVSGLSCGKTQCEEGDLNLPAAATSLRNSRDFRARRGAHGHQLMSGTSIRMRGVWTARCDCSRAFRRHESGTCSLYGHRAACLRPGRVVASDQVHRASYAEKRVSSGSVRQAQNAVYQYVGVDFVVGR